MTSLKHFCDDIAALVGMTPAAVYERQRVLMRAGLLHSEEGRGPGSGARATPKSVALLLVSLLATGSLSETEECTRIFAHLKSKDGPCPLTGKKTFVDAVAEILESVDAAGRVIGIDVSHATMKVRIDYKESGKKGPLSKSSSSLFGTPRAPDEPGLSVRSWLSGWVLQKLHGQLIFYWDLENN